MMSLILKVLRQTYDLTKKTKRHNHLAFEVPYLSGARLTKHTIRSLQSLACPLAILWEKLKRELGPVPNLEFAFDRP